MSLQNRRAVVIGLAAAMWMLPGTMRAADFREVTNLSSRCRAGNDKACAKLAKLAQQDKDATIRQSAAGAITDQALLAQIALQDENDAVRSAAARNLRDQEMLAKVAAGSSDPEVRNIVVPWLTDQQVLAKLAVGDSDATVRAAAVKNVSDQALLASIASAATDTAVQHDAFARLTDPSVLARIVGGEVKTVRSRVSNDPLTFAPTVTITVGKDGWISGMNQGQPQTVAPKDNKSFLIVEITFEPKGPFEMGGNEIRLMVPDSQGGTQDPVAIFGDPSFVHTTFVRQADGTTTTAESEPQWEALDGKRHQQIMISGRRTLSWLFLIGRGSDLRQGKLLVQRAPFDLGIE